MSRSMFDPTSHDMLEEGGRYSTPAGENASTMPPDLVDGVVERDDDAQVPLKGSEPTGLPPDATEKLAQAARDASGDPDNDAKTGLYPGESPDEEGTVSMQDA